MSGPVCLFLALCLVAVPAGAQQAPPKVADAHTATLAQGWAALASGDLVKARAAAQSALEKAPRSASALALAVEVEIAASGPVAALNAYERWMQTKKVEEPYVLRRVATAFLQAAARQGNSGTVGAEALKALIADGDAVAAASLAEGGSTGGVRDPRIRAAAGDERAVQTLITQLQSMPGKASTIKALADSGSRLAIAPLMDILASGRDDDRVAAADGLGRLGAREAVSQLKPLLDHANFTVRMTAAAALYRLDDDSGAQILSQLLASEHPAVRLAAAEALSVRPGVDWLEVARGLTSAPDEAVQLGAARLVAPYDQALAESVLARLGQSENLAVREEVSRVLAESVVNDFPTLRQLLRSQDGATSVRAAIRLTHLVR